MKLKKIIQIGIGSHFIVFLAMIFLPVFIVTDQWDVFERIIFYILEK